MANSNIETSFQNLVNIIKEKTFSATDGANLTNTVGNIQLDITQLGISKIGISQIGIAGGVDSLDSSGKIPSSQVDLPTNIATLDGNNKLQDSQTNYVSTGRKSGTTVGNCSTAEGYRTTSSAQYAHAEGNQTQATASAAHAEGTGTQATNQNTHAEGWDTIASNKAAHSEGHNTAASAAYSHAEGEATKAQHSSSHAEGLGTQTGAEAQHVQGKYNIGKSTTLLEIGNGTADNSRSNAFEVSSAGDVAAAGEIIDGGSNTLSDKYDATSLTFPNERFTISSSGWSSTQTGGYYTYTLSTGDTKYNTYCPVFMDKTGVNDSTDPTSAEEAAYALVDKFDMADGTGVNSFTLYAKTKPTTTFYVKLSGQYMAKNAASSSKALDIETANALTISQIGSGNGISSKSVEFNGGAEHALKYITCGIHMYAEEWSSTVDSNGYYTNSETLPERIDTSCVVPKVFLIGNGYQGVPDFNSLSSTAYIAAYNLVDYFDVTDNGTETVITAYAKTKPSNDFNIGVEGISIS